MPVFRGSRWSSLARPRAALVPALVAAALCASATSALAWNVNVNIVRQAKPPTWNVPPNTRYFTTIQAAVNASSAGDYVLIEPGVYDEEVKVTSAHSGIWISGMNRNTVIVDGQHKAGQRHRNRSRRTTSGWKTSRCATSISAKAAETKRAATRSGGTAAPSPGRSARTAGTGAT